MRTLDLGAAHWRKSTRSDASNTCVEVAFAGPAVGLHDSKNPAAPHWPSRSPAFNLDPPVILVGGGCRLQSR